MARPDRFVFAMFFVAALSFSACGIADVIDDLQNQAAELTQEELEKLPVEVEGETAAAGAKNAIQSAVQDASRAPSGGGSSVASQVNPDARVFSDDDSSSAPGFLPLEDEKTNDDDSNDDSNDDIVSDVSDWEGPMKGPDGEDGWYRRTWSYTETFYPAGGSAETKVINYYYYFTSDSAYDFRKGWYGFKGTKIGYAWTSDHPLWNEKEGDTRWIMTIEFRQPQVVGDQTLPGAAVGTWDWKVADKSPYGSGSYAKGTFIYYISKLDFHYFGSDEFRQQVSDAAVGEEISFGFLGRSSSTYEGVSRWRYQGSDDSDINELKYFGGGEYIYGFSATITKTAEKRGDIAYSYEASGTYYYGAGMSDASVNYMERPDYVSDGTDGPGKIWGKAVYNNNDDSKDGLLYWSDYEYWTLFSTKDVSFDDDDDNDDHDGDHDSTSSYYSRSETLTYNGGEPGFYVSCSDKSVAPDCPDEQDDNQ